MATTIEATERVAYSPTEVARLLGLSRALIYRELREGTIPSSRLGDRILVPRAWVDGFGS